MALNRSEKMEPTMKIWIDADACPRVIKEIVFRASGRLKIPVCLVANKSLAKHETHLVQCVVVGEGFDVADDYIADNAAPEDLVITADIPWRPESSPKVAWHWIHGENPIRKTMWGSGYPCAT